MPLPLIQMLLIFFCYLCGLRAWNYAPVAGYPWILALLHCIETIINKLDEESYGKHLAIPLSDPINPVKRNLNPLFTIGL